MPDRVGIKLVPILDWLPSYDRSRLGGDAVAGLSVWALLVPQALAYASIAGVPVQYGLYTAFAALVAYPLFGSSRHLVQGPSAAVCAVSAAVVAPIVGSASMGTEKAVGYTAALALATAAVYLALGLLRMGWVSTFLSKAVMAGFVLGFSLGIIIDQAHKLLGVPAVDGSYVQELWGTLEQLPNLSGATLAVGCGSLGLLLAMRYRLPRWPRMAIVMALAIAVVVVLDLGQHGVAVTGDVPTGLFSVGLPGVGWSETGALLAGAFSVVFVGYSETLAAGRAMSGKHGYEIDPDQELVAQGAACAAAGLAGGFVTDGSLSKTSVADAAGQQTQVASLINAGLVLLTMLFLAGIFKDLPSAALAAVVIDAMVGLITLSEMRRYYRVNRADWVFFMGAMVGILCLGIVQGIVIGVVLSLLLLIARASTTSVRRLERDPRSGAYHDAARHTGLEPTPGLLVARVDGPLFFADADRFRAQVYELLREADRPAAVVIDAESVHLSDTDGADMLLQLVEELRARASTTALAQVHPQILALWARAGVIDAVGHDRVFGSVPEAVAALAVQRQDGRPQGGPPAVAGVTHRGRD